MILWLHEEGLHKLLKDLGYDNSVGNYYLKISTHELWKDDTCTNIFRVELGKKAVKVAGKKAILEGLRKRYDSL